MLGALLLGSGISAAVFVVANDRIVRRTAVRDRSPTRR